MTFSYSGSQFHKEAPYMVLGFQELLMLCQECIKTSLNDTFTFFLSQIVLHDHDENEVSNLLTSSVYKSIIFPLQTIHLNM